MLKSDAAAYLAGVTQVEGAQASAPTNLHVITGEVGQNSEEGKTTVSVDGLVFSEEDSQEIEMDTLGGLEEGDIATIILTGEAGHGMTPLAIGAVGSVDRINAKVIETQLLLADKADIQDLTAATARIGDLEADNVTINGRLQAAELDIDGIQADYLKAADLQAEQARVGNLLANKADVSDLNAATGRIDNLEADHVSVADFQAEQANIDTLQTNTADIATIRANSAKVQNLTAAQLEADHATVGSLSTTYATISNLNAANGRIDTLESTKANISDLEADYITADEIEATYMHANMSNSDVAWIENGTIKNGAIVSAMINDVSANKLTAGTINGSVINVTNLNADNITTGTINGQRIGTGSLSLDKLADDVYTEAEVNNIVDGLNDRIDGAIETHTGTAVPTLNNSPASSWNTTKLRDEHVGDVYYVVNSQSQQNGYCYRFTKSGSTYSWQLIKDSDVTAALSRLTTAEGKITTFDSDISTLKTDTGTLTTRTTSLETRMSDAEDDILDKVDTTTFNEVSDTVDAHTQTISQHTTAISNKADSSTVTAVTNRVSKNEQDISGINTTIGQLQTTVASKADGSTVTTISNKLNTVSDTVDGHTQTITSVQNTLSTKADSSTVSTITTKVNTVSDTVDGHTSQLTSITSTQTSMQSTLDKTVKSSIQLWYSKANTTAPGKPTSQVTSTSTSGGAWRIVVPAYNASYPNYYYCWQYEYTDGTYGWSAVVRDIAMGESQATARTADSNATAAATSATNAQNTANANIKSSVQLWFTKANFTAPSKPTSVVSTSNANTANAWNLVVPVWNSSYPHYFYCYQQQKGDGTYQWTDVIYDRATSEAQQLANTTSTNLSTLQEDYATYKQTTTENVSSIGTRLTTAEGKISTAESNITQNAQNIELKVSKDGVISSINQSAESVKIQASRVEIDGTAVFNAIKSSTDTAYDAKGSAAAVQSNLDNLSVGRNLLVGSSTGTGWSYQTFDRDTVTYVRATTAVTESYVTAPLMTLKAGETYTLSCWAKSNGSVKNMDLYKVHGSGSGSHQYRTSIPLTTEWQKIVWTFVNNATSDETVTMRFDNNGSVSSGTEAILYVREPKLEYGSNATPWIPPLEDLVTRTQRIYYRWNSATAPAAPTTWVTKNDDGSALWTKMHVSITESYKYIYTCEQYQMADGTLGHTDVLLDNTITVIDGGNIITGTVTANKLNASDINASKTLTVGAMTDAAAATILNSEMVGDIYQSAQPNLTPFFEIAPTDTTYWFATGNLSSYTTRLENGWSHVELSNLNLNVSPRVGVLDLSESTTYTVMLEVRNAVTLTNCRLYIYTATNSTWSASKNIVVAANGTYYITGVTKADLSSTDITHLRVFFGSDTSTANADIRLSLYEGEYSGPYKPYNGGQLYAHKSDVAWTGTCDTAAGTAAKEVVCDGFTASELTMGATICVRFNAANTSSGALTLNVNGTGAKPISVATGATSATNQLLWASGATIRFMYNTSLGQWRVADTTPTYYSTCSIAEGVAAKTAGCAGCVIFKGVAIHIIMTAANTNTSATLNVNSTGAKAIYYGNTTTRPTTANEYGWKAGATASFVFDGAYWRYADASAMYQSADAAKTASNYITTIDANNGIKIANANPSSATTYMQLASNFLDFIRGGVSMLKAWVDETTTTAKVRVGAEQIDGTDAFNTLTDNEGIKLRRGTTVLSQFATNLIELGKNSYNATISLLNNGIEIYATDIDPDHRIHFGRITSGDSYLQFAPWSTVEGDESAYSASAKFGVKHEFTSTRGFGVDDSVNIGGDGFVGLTTALVDSDDVPLAEAGMYAATNIGAGNSEIAIIGDKVFLYDGSGNTSTYYGPFPMSDVASAIPVTLYDNASAAASATATLSETAANFKRLTIFFKDTDGNYSSTEVWSPNGKRVALSLTWINGASTQDMYQRVRWVTISGTTISTYKGSSDSKYRTGQVKLGATASVANSDYLAIVHVIGYR